MVFTRQEHRPHHPLDEGHQPASRGSALPTATMSARTTRIRQRPARMNRHGALLASEYQASVRPLCPHRSAKISGPRGFRGITPRTVGENREGMIEMAALGLLLVIVVIGAVVYIAGVAWLARLDVRQDESPPPETISPKLPNLRS